MYSELLVQSQEEDRAAVILLGSSISVAGAASLAEGDYTKGSALIEELVPSPCYPPLLMLLWGPSVALIT